jgi:hypothetical protein
MNSPIKVRVADAQATHEAARDEMALLVESFVGRHPDGLESLCSVMLHAVAARASVGLPGTEDARAKTAYALYARLVGTVNGFLAERVEGN